MRRVLSQRLLAILIVAAGLAPAAALAQAPKAAAATPPAKAAKPPAAPKAAAAPAARAEPAPYSLAVDSTITLRPDRTAETVSTRRIKILGEGALQSVGQQTLAYVEGMQSLDIVEAYTEKADGRRIAVDPASIITRDEASGLNAVYLRDAKARTVIFPDLAVGDTIVLTARSEAKSGVFPGHYVHHTVFARQIPFADSTLRIVVPKELTANVAALGKDIGDTVVEEAGVTRHVVAYHPAARAADEPGATSPLDRDPRVFVSTFKDFDELGRAYWAEASKRAAVMPEIQALADEITAGIADKRAQAAAIDRWVKSNVRYVAVYLGVGRVVPNDANTVLKNKYGDCKDQATFMTALLAAKGIASEQVLINGGNAYALDAPATLAALNHVIVYLPEFAVYDDPTASFTGFGVLTDTYDKPALHLSADGAHLARTPVMRPQDHTLTTQTRVTIAANGTVSGETKQSATGLFTAFARAVATAIQNNGPETVAERQLQAFGTPGKGRYEIESPRNLAEPYLVKGRFTLNDRFAAPPAGRKAIPIGIPILSRPGELLLGARAPGRKLPFTCLAGRQVEEIDVTFPEGMPLNNPLQGRKIATKLFTYKSDYRFEGRTLKIRHEFVSLVPNQVCGADIEADIGRPMAEVRASVNSRLAVSSPAAPPAAKKPPETGFGAFFRSR
jgi:transglutaminase-like putative cysteine protease